MISRARGGRLVGILDDGWELLLMSTISGRATAELERAAGRVRTFLTSHA
jgi:hypothetical protein